MRWVALSLLVACSGSSKKEITGAGGRVGPDAGGGIDAMPDPHIPRLSGPPRLIDGLYFVDEGAPDPLACRADKDCIGDTVPDDTGCCVRSSDAVPQTWVWHTWMTERRLSGKCDEVKCPPIPVGKIPEQCKLEVKCVSSRCANTCK
jgi:hypothetical protein